MPPEQKGLFFNGDGRLVQCPSDTIPLFTGPVPAWLVADWMLADSRGEPISNYARACVELAAQGPSQGLRWLKSFLN